VPEGTASFALVVDDPDAPRGTFVHWLLWGVPGAARGLDEGASVGVTGRNDVGRTGYGGPCPPKGHGSHHYRFRLYALDVPSLGVAEGGSRDGLERAIEGHVLDESLLVGLYARD